MNKCYHCGQESVIWDNDFSFEDYGYDGEGIVSVYHCCTCGATIEVNIPLIKEEEELDK